MAGRVAAAAAGEFVAVGIDQNVVESSSVFEIGHESVAVTGFLCRMVGI